MKNNYFFLSLLAVLLTGCQVLNFKTEPATIPDCQYNKLSGTEFQFDKLAENQINKGFNHVYVAQSRASAKLSAKYQNMHGKLTGKVFEVNYRKINRWGRQASIYDLFYDNNDNEDIYLTPQQKEKRDKEAKYVFYQAILTNCQVVYVSVNSLADTKFNPQLVNDKGLTLINY